MTFCENRIGHGDTIEYSASEAGKLYEGDEGLEERSKELLKCLKCMLDHLLYTRDDR